VTALDTIFGHPEPLGTRPRDLQVSPSGRRLAFRWDANARGALAMYLFEYNRLQRLDGDRGVFTATDCLITWSGSRVVDTSTGREVHFDERVEDVQVREDRALVVTHGRLHDLDIAAMTASELFAATGGEQLLACVRWSDGDLMTFRGPEQYRLLGPGARTSAVTWRPDPASALPIARFLDDPVTVRLDAEPRRGRYAVLHGQDLDQRYELPDGARLYNVGWLPGDGGLVVDWVATDRRTRTIELLAADGHRSTLFAEVAHAWHAPLARLCRPHPTQAALLLTTERTGRCAAAVLDLAENLTLTEAPHEVKDAHWSGHDTEIIVLAAAVTPGELRPLRGQSDGLIDLAQCPGLCHDIAVGDGAVAWVRSTPDAGWLVEFLRKGVLTAVTEPAHNASLLRPTPRTAELRGGAPATVYDPSAPNGAGVVFVHGNGYLQDAVHGQHPWYWREHLFNRLLARSGYCIVSPEYAGSEGYGQAWATAVYRQLGTRELNDLAGAHDRLVADGCDPHRITLYGGSHGGYLVLRALLLQPELWCGGVALRAVTDWTAYARSDPLFVEQRLGDPDSSSQPYAESTILGMASRLRRPLLLLHGLVDENVPVAHIVHFLEEAVQQGTANHIQMMLYPSEAHAFACPASWLDEYGRILQFVTRVTATQPAASSAADQDCPTTQP